MSLVRVIHCTAWVLDYLVTWDYPRDVFTLALIPGSKLSPSQQASRDIPEMSWDVLGKVVAVLGMYMNDDNNVGTSVFIVGWAWHINDIHNVIQHQVVYVII